MTAAAPVWSPACLDDDDLAGWSLFNQRITGPGRATSPCADCTTAFADEMRPLGRCNGTPGATGQVMALPTPIRVPEEDPLTAPAPPALPCEDCLHAAVCKLRDLIPMVTGPIEVGPGLRVRYTEVVECDHYLVETQERRFLRQRVAELAPVPTPTDRRPAQSPDDLEAMRQLAIARGDQPYGAVVVCDGRIVGEGVSAVITNADPTAHAEMQAIRDAVRGHKVARRLLRKEASRHDHGCEHAEGQTPTPVEGCPHVGVSREGLERG